MTWKQSTFGPIRSVLPGSVRIDKNTAWLLCVVIGLENGIPEHAWKKAHGSNGWYWYTSSFKDTAHRGHLVAAKRARNGSQTRRRRTLKERWSRVRYVEGPDGKSFDLAKHGRSLLHVRRWS